MKHEQAPTAPEIEGVSYVFFFVYFKYIFYKNRYFWPIWQLQVGFFKPKLSKDTSTDQYLSFEPITKSLGHSARKVFPVQAQVSKNRYYLAILANLTTSGRVETFHLSL